MKNTTKILESEAEYIQANERVSELMDLEFELGSEIHHEIQLLVLLIKDFQSKHYVLEPVDPITHIKIRMEELGLEPKDLVKYIGDRSTVTKILNKKRDLTASMMRQLHTGLNIPANALLAV